MPFTIIYVVCKWIRHIQTQDEAMNLLLILHYEGIQSYFISCLGFIQKAEPLQGRASTIETKNPEGNW